MFSQSDDKTLALRLAALLASAESRIVLAESCTCGMAAALLGAVPGISRYLCGSWVTYRNASKSSWLGVESATIERYTAVSREVTAAMAICALERTPEAEWSAAITGHLGPESPEGQDGLIWMAIARRGRDGDMVDVNSRQLLSIARESRQREAAHELLNQLYEVIVRET